MRARVIQGFFPGGQPKLASVQPRIAAPPPIQAKTASPAPATAFAGRPPGPPIPAFGARPSGPPAPAFGPRTGAVQRHGAGNAFAVDSGALGLASGGKPLPPSVRGKMEAALGADFSNVRVHVGPQAERIGAIAFTVGSDIYFAPGRYQPDTLQGQRLLGHELAHVVQQRAGRVRNPLGSGLAVVQDHALEAEADRLGQRAAMHRVAAQAKMPAGASQPSAPVRVSPPISVGPGSYRLTAGAAGRQVGSVMVHVRGKGAVEVTDLHVTETQRGHGVGRMLLASAARTGQQFGQSKVTLAAQDNGSGHLTQWYKGMGFAQTGVNQRGHPQLEAPISRVLFGAVRRQETGSGWLRLGQSSRSMSGVAQGRMQPPHARPLPIARASSRMLSFTAIQRHTPAYVQRMLQQPGAIETISIHPGGNSSSAQALRITGIPELYWRFIFPGGTVYRRSNTDPLDVFRDGWSRDGYPDLVRHTDTDQGIGSNWVATTQNLVGMDERYGTYAFEIEIDWHQGVVVNPAYLALTRHRNPHAEQNEVAVWKNIRGDQVTAVWVPIPHEQRTANNTWADSYARYTRRAYMDAREAGVLSHPPPN